jgi:hypothetical protein
MEIIAEHPFASEKFKMTAVSSVKIPPEAQYVIPPQMIRNRINSECLTFMNYQEIEKAAKAKAKAKTRKPRPHSRQRPESS